MTRRPELTSALKNQIDAILDKSARHFQNDEVEAALMLAHDAWNIIPEPKEKWDYYPQSLAAAFVKDYVELQKTKEAKEWIQIVYRVYDDEKRESIYTLFIEGRALFKLGLKDESYSVFKRIYELSGSEWFKDEHEPYLDFFLLERKKRDQ